MVNSLALKVDDPLTSDTHEVAVPLGPPVKVIRSGERGKLLNLSQISQQRCV